MNTVRNYQKELDQIIEKIGAAGTGAPTLFLHSCCAPCSSYVLEYLRKYFRITVFYYNPNITENAEYRKRVTEQKRMIETYNRILTERVNFGSGESGLTDAGKVQDLDGSRNEQSGKVYGEILNAGNTTGVRQSAQIADNDRPGGYEIRIVEGDYEPQRFFETARGMEACPEGAERCFACYELRLLETAKQAQAGGYDYFTTTLSISPLKNAAKLNEIGERLAAGYGVAWLPSDFKKREGYKRSIELSKEYDLYRQDYCGCVYSKAERERQKAREAQHILDGIS